jgi:hypothetical protein
MLKSSERTFKRTAELADKVNAWLMRKAAKDEAAKDEAAKDKEAEAVTAEVQPASGEEVQS